MYVLLIVHLCSSDAGNAGLRDALGTVRALLFYVWTLALSVPLFVVMLTLWPVVMLFDKVK